MKQVKKALSLVLVITMLLSSMVIPASAAAGVSFSLSSDNKAPTAGDEFTVTVSINQAVSEVGALDFYVDYGEDMTVVESASGASGAVLDEMLTNNYLNTNKFKYSASAVDYTNGDTVPAGVLVTIKFKVKDSVEGVASIPTLTIDTFADANYANISYEVVAEIYNAAVAITKPVKGAVPQSTIAATEKYTGEISWTPAVNDGKFAAETTYTANVTLTAKAGYKFAADAAAAVTDATISEKTVSTDGSALSFKATFPATAGKDALVGRVIVEGTPKYGETLTAKVDSADGLNDQVNITYQWVANGVEISGATGKTYKLTVNEIGKMIRVTVTATAASQYSGYVGSPETAKVEKADGPTAPGKPSLNTKDATSVTLTELTGGNYQYSKDGTNWQNSNVFTGLNPNTEYSFYLRIKETDTHKASATSEVLKVTTDKEAASDPVKPTLESKTDTTIKMKAVSGQKYMIKLATEAAPTAGGTGWSDSAEFTGLNRNTKYKVYTYVAETASAVASRVVSTEVTTDKTTITDSMVPMSGTTVTYNGAAHKPGFSGSLTEGTHYTVEYTCKTGGKLLEGRPCGAGTYTITVTGTGDYTGSFTKDFVINKLPATLSWNNTTDRKFGDNKTVTATVSNKIMGDDVNVTVNGGDKTTVGTHTAIAAALTGKAADNYALPTDASACKTSYVINKADALTGIKAEFTLPYTTTGAQTVSIGDFNLPETVQNPYINTTTGGKTDANGIISSYSATSFTLASGLTDAYDGKTASWTVVIQSDNYANITATVTVKTVKKNVDTTTMSVSLDGWTYGDSANTPAVTGKPDGAGTVTYKYSGTGSTSYSESTTVPTNAGTYSVTATCETATTIYSASANFTISQKSISGATVTLDKTTTEYNTHEQTVSVTAVEGGLTASDYDVSGQTKGTDVNTYTVTVTGKGNFSPL